MNSATWSAFSPLSTSTVTSRDEHPKLLPPTSLFQPQPKLQSSPATTSSSYPLSGLSGLRFSAPASGSHTTASTVQKTQAICFASTSAPHSTEPSTVNLSVGPTPSVDRPNWFAANISTHRERLVTQPLTFASATRPPSETRGTPMMPSVVKSEPTSDWSAFRPTSVSRSPLSPFPSPFLLAPRPLSESDASATSTGAPTAPQTAVTPGSAATPTSVPSPIDKSSDSESSVIDVLVDSDSRPSSVNKSESLEVAPSAVDNSTQPAVESAVPDGPKQSSTNAPVGLEPPPSYSAPDSCSSLHCIPVNLRSSEFFYPDGNVIIKVQDVYFKLFRSRLTRHCLYCKTRFEGNSDSAPPQEVFDGCSVYTMSEVAILEFETFLRFLEFPM